MVWTSGPTSIILPSDRVTGDGRNYMIMGEDVPPQIADSFTAAVVFYSGQHDGTESSDIATGLPAGFVFYAIGISKLGNLEFVVYFFTTGSPNSDAYTYYRQTVLSIAAPTLVSAQPGVPNGPVLSLGTNPNYGSYSNGPTATVIGVGNIIHESVSTGPATATSTTAVTIPGIGGNITLTTARRLIFTLSVMVAQGASGGELGRLNILSGGASIRRAQWYAAAAGGSGEVSPSITYEQDFSAGTYAITANVLRVAGGTSVTVNNVSLIITDGGAA